MRLAEPGAQALDVAYSHAGYVAFDNGRARMIRAVALRCVSIVLNRQSHAPSSAFESFAKTTGARKEVHSRGTGITGTNPPLPVTAKRD
jgi:hypothetical protein